MIIFKMLFALLFILGWMFLLTLIIGETHALNNTNPRFTKWWRKHLIGTEDELYSRKQNKK
jgi:hypothetical protein